MKKYNNMNKKIKYDLIFAKRTEEAWKRYEKGEVISMDFNDFLQEVKKW